MAIITRKTDPTHIKGIIDGGPVIVTFPNRRDNAFKRSLNAHMEAMFDVSAEGEFEDRSFDERVKFFNEHAQDATGLVFDDPDIDEEKFPGIKHDKDGLIICDSKTPDALLADYGIDSWVEALTDADKQQFVRGLEGERTRGKVELRKN